MTDKERKRRKERERERGRLVQGKRRGGRERNPGSAGSRRKDREVHTLFRFAFSIPFFSTRRFNAMIKSALGKKMKSFLSPSSSDEARGRTCVPSSHCFELRSRCTATSIPASRRHLVAYVVAESSLEEKKKGTKKKIVIISNKYYWSFECLLKEIPGSLSLASFGIGGRER